MHISLSRWRGYLICPPTSGCVFSVSKLFHTPKSGFSNKDFAKRYDYVNLGSLEKVFAAGAEVTPEALKKAGIIHDVTRVKVLANGALTKALKVSAHGFSATAKAAIEKAGGTVTVLEQKTK